MSKSKITITLDHDILIRIDSLLADLSHHNRSRFISEAILEKLERTAPYLTIDEDLEPEPVKPRKEEPSRSDEWSEL